MNKRKHNVTNSMDVFRVPCTYTEQTRLCQGVQLPWSERATEDESKRGIDREGASERKLYK